MMQPVGQGLTRDAAGGTVLHQPHVMDVGHFRTAHPLIDPAHHIAQNALRVVGNLLKDLLGGILPRRGKRQRQQIIQPRRTPGGGNLGLPAGHIDAVVMRGMQRRRRGARHPGAAGPGQRMRPLLCQHRRHLIGGRPHALADLRAPGQAAGQPDIDIAVLIGADPGHVLHRRLAQHRTGLHPGVNLIPGTVQKTCIDESHAPLGRADTFLEIGRSAPLFVHDPQLDRVRRQAKHRLDPGKDLIGKGHLFGAVHLRLDHIDGAGLRIARRRCLAQIMQRGQRGDHRVHHPLARLLPLAVGHHGGGHQVAHIAHQHQRPTFQPRGLTIGRPVRQIIVERAGECRTVLVHLRGQIAPHEAHPVAVGLDLVLGIHRRDAVLAIHDRRKCGFQDHVTDPRRVRRADRAGRIDHQPQMQPVDAQEHLLRRAAIPRELRRISEGDGPGAARQPQLSLGDRNCGHIGPARAAQRHDRVQMCLGMGHHAGPARRIIPPARWQIAQSIGAI